VTRVLGGRNDAMAARAERLAQPALTHD